MLQSNTKALDQEVAPYTWEFSASPQSPQAKVVQNGGDRKASYDPTDSSNQQG